MHGDGRRFSVASVMMAVLFVCSEIAQQHRRVEQSETEPDDLPYIKRNQGENVR